MKMSKLLALILALCMVLSIGAFASGEPSADPSAEPSAEAADGASVEEAFIDYIHEWLLAELEVNGNMTIEQVEDEFMPLVEQMDFVTFPAEMIYSGMLEQGVPMTFEEFEAQYVPAAGAAEGGLSVEEAFIEYIHEWLIAEDEANDTMTEEIRENEFMPLVEQMDFVTFPAEMIYSGMLETGVPMTFEEFAAQYTPAAAAPAAGGYTVDEAGWKQYLKDYVSAVPAAQEHLDEFFAAIDAGEFYTMPGDMLFQDTFWGYSAATLDEFVAAGGAVEIPAFDPNLTAD